MPLIVRPDYAESILDRGNALHQLQRHEDALASYDRALALRPDYAEALSNWGNVYFHGIEAVRGGDDELRPRAHPAARLCGGGALELR